jgi:hypothetical protein
MKNHKTKMYVGLIVIFVSLLLLGVNLQVKADTELNLPYPLSSATAVDTGKTIFVFGGATPVPSVLNKPTIENIINSDESRLNICPGTGGIFLDEILSIVPSENKITELTVKLPLNLVSA